MPIVHVIENRKSGRRLLDLIVPKLRAPGLAVSHRWDWPELCVGSSAIQGFGLFPKSSEELDWSKLQRPIVAPYLGMETEVESSTQARVLRSVLCGGFDVVIRRQLDAHTPEGHVWVQDGLYVTLMEDGEACRLDPPLERVDEPETKLIQVPVEPEWHTRSVSYLEAGDEQVCYLNYEEARALLHLPNHIMELLGGHADDQHADRNMATHLVQFSRDQHTHLLVSAHPLFRNTAFIMGNVNEPPRGAPSMELYEMRLTLATNDDPLMLRAGVTQSEAALAHFDTFAAEHPEVQLKSTFFCTRKANFVETEELTVVYGASYKRTYSTRGHAGVPHRYHIPYDEFEDGAWSGYAAWPARCPGWFNPDVQPLNRPAFERVDGPVDVPAKVKRGPGRPRGPKALRENHKPDEAFVGGSAEVPRGGAVRVLPDLPGIVKARRLGLDGDLAEQRAAKIRGLSWDPKLPQLRYLADGSTRSGLDGAGYPFAVPREVRFARFFEGWKGRREFGRIEFESLASALGGLGEHGIGAAEAGAEAGCGIEPFSIPAELSECNRDELNRLVRLEDERLSKRRGRAAQALYCDDSQDSDEEEEEIDWDTPWCYPLGSVVWAKMDGFSWWPAEVVNPEVMDRDIAKMKDRYAARSWLTYDLGEGYL